MNETISRRVIIGWRIKYRCGCVLNAEPTPARIDDLLIRASEQVCIAHNNCKPTEITAILSDERNAI